MTGDIKFCPDADIVVMTTEILRNLLFKRGTATESVGSTALVSMDGVDAVVFDEVHYINDADRGHVWEETLMLLPPAVHLILLSATLSTPEPFARWLAEIKGVRIWLISTLWRAVPLEHCLVDWTSGQFQPVLTSREVFNADTYRAWLADGKAGQLAHDKFKEKVREARRRGDEGPVGGKTRPKAFEHRLNECMRRLETTACLPAIAFVFSRKGCERMAGDLTGSYLDSSDAATVAHIWDFHLSRFRDSLEVSPQAHALRALAMRGIAYHHSGLLPFLKEILEILFAKGLVKVLFATETFAVGINMPTKTVIFTALEKFSDSGMRCLQSAEYIQMAGRAGRRGKDDRGLVLHLPQREPLDLEPFRAILMGRAGSFGSRLNFHYDFVLKLRNAGRPLRDLLEGSYWWRLAQIDHTKKELELTALREAVSAAAACISETDRCACQEKYDLDIAVHNSQNARKKAANRAVVAWKDEHPMSKWGSVLERFDRWMKLEAQLKEAEMCFEPVGADAEAHVSLRLQMLSECEYAEKEGEKGLTPLGRLASEVNEGHPFLMAELFGRLRQAEILPSLEDLLIILSTFVAEGSRNDNVAKSPDQLDVSKEVCAELWRLDADARRFMVLEKRIGLPCDPEYWELSTEFVEPVSAWLATDEPLAVVAARYEMFEGNFQKGLLKLASLIEEFQSLATLAGEPRILALLAEARPRVLRGVVVAESLYLRL
jgi:superfamily II RNA helicase